MNQSNADLAIEKFNEGKKLTWLDLTLHIAAPNIARKYLEEEVVFSLGLEGLRDHVTIELAAIAQIIDEVTDYAVAAGDLATRRDNLKAIQVEIEGMVPEDVLAPDPTSTPGPAKVGDRSMPVAPGKTFIFTHREAQCAIVFQEVMRGQSAQDFRNRNEKYTTYSATEGREIYLARFTVANLAGSEDKSVTFDDGDFNIEIDGKMYGRTISIWDEALGATLYPGGEDTGWVVFQVPIGSNVQHIKFRPSFADFSIWFSVP